MTDARVGGVHGQVVVTPPPAAVRAGHAHIQALVTPPPAASRVHSVHIQVLAPVQSVPIVGGIHAQALVAIPTAISCVDGVTAVQQLHADGVWRPLTLAATTH